MIKQFFDDIKLVEARIYLYNLLEVVLPRPTTIYDDASERDKALCFVKQLEKLIEASFAVSRK